MRELSLILLVTCAMGLSGCASGARQHALKLADSGGKIAKITEATVAETRSQLDTYVETQMMFAPLTGRTDPSPEMLASISRLAKALAAREAVMRQLAEAYTSMSAHASYDATAKVEDGVNGLAGAINEYGKALSGPGISSPIAWLLKTTTGGMVGSKQARELRAASRGIREPLERFETLLMKEKAVLASVRAILVENRAESARQFWHLGLGRPTLLLQRQVEGFGLAYDEKQFDSVLSALKAQPSISSNSSRAEDLRKAIEAAIKHRSERQAQLQEEMLEDTAAALRALITAHRAFEAKSDADLPALTDYLATIRGKVDEFTKLTR